MSQTPIESSKGHSFDLPDFEVSIPRTGSVEEVRQSILHHLHFTLAKDNHSATERDCFEAVALSIRDHLVQGWTQTQRR
ncbi:MAG: hypothetical protein KDK78_07010, partial [Chlamydiia bacterium]|nr:hypothetical protein [Chlamydiia bacterium]